jgi:hypothetical protein
LVQSLNSPSYSPGSKKFVFSMKLLTLEGSNLVTLGKWKLDAMQFHGRVDPGTTTIKKKGEPTLYVSEEIEPQFIFTAHRYRCEFV